MRVSGLYNANMMTYQMGKNGTQMNKLMQQMSTLQRVNVPSDDPIASSRMVQLNREQSHPVSEQYLAFVWQPIDAGVARDGAEQSADIA